MSDSRPRHGDSAALDVDSSFAGQVCAQEADVRAGSETFCDDERIAARIANVVRLSFDTSLDQVTIRVDAGWVALEGDVGWIFQSQDLEDFTRRITGVKGVTNTLTVRHSASAEDILADVRRALHSSSEVNPQTIDVSVDGNCVTLSGRLEARNARTAAELAVRSVPSVHQVLNHIQAP